MIILSLLVAALSAQAWEFPAMSPRYFPPMMQRAVPFPIDQAFMAAQVPPPISATTGLRFSYGLQPLETLRTVAGRKVRGLAVALVVTCNDAPAPIHFSQDRMVQYLHEQGVEPVISQLALSTLDHASSTSPLEIAAQVAGFTGQAASLLMASGVVAAIPGVQVAVLLATEGAKRLIPKVERRAADAALLARLQIEGPDVDLMPGQCISRAPLVRWPVKGRK